MLVNGIKPYEDEILYSIVARYIAFYGTKGPNQLLPHLFEKGNISSTLNLPSGISALARSFVLNGLTPDEIIFNHTLYPLYNRFISIKKRNLILKSMYGKSGDIHTRIGLNAGNISSTNYPRYCPQCYQEDQQTSHQESYYRRAHQIPTINICTIHNLQLHNVDNFRYRYNKHEFISINESKAREDHIENKNKQLLHLSRKVVELLNYVKVYDYNNEPYFYHEKMKKIGFTKGQKSINSQNLYAEFTSYYKQETLKTLESSVNINDESCWLKLAVRKRRRDINPVRHLLLINFIEQFEDPSKFNASLIKKACRNPVCPDYNSFKKTKVSFKTDSKSRREITHVVCLCGYHYTESYNHEKNTINRSVREYGKLWQEYLKKLLLKNLSIREVARRLHCDSKTVLFSSQRTCKPTDSKYLDVKRQEWAKHQKTFPKKSVTELRKLRPDLYSILYRNDKNWLLDIQYTAQKNTSVKNERVNWKERDEKWAAIMEARLRGLKITDFKKRISKTLLLKLLKHETTFSKNKDKLPLCRLFIEINEESFHAFRKRRILREARKMMTQSSVIIKWQLIRKAGIRKEHLNEELEMIIDSLVEDSKNLLSLSLAS
jgi:hypothetical protein